ncbi:MAG: dTDP-4-dehydrorhamnose reductase [Planctomycetota bacterium]
MSEPSVTLIGAAGMLGRAWCELLDGAGIAYAAMDRSEIDIADPATLDRIDPGTTHVINCAAYTAVDKAEDEEELATAINGHAVGHLATRAAAIDAVLVNYSTDYVFDGNATSPYAIDQPRDPLNAYGRSKAVGEALLEESNAAWLNIRTSWLYAPWGNNFVLTMARLTADKPTLKVVDDQRGRPTSAQHLAETTLSLIDAVERGVAQPGHHHVTDGGECTWCGFTRAINDRLGHACDVQPCTTADFPRPAKRPAYSVLDLSATEAALGPMPEWTVNLRSVLDRMTGSVGSTG